MIAVKKRRAVKLDRCVGSNRRISTLPRLGAIKRQLGNHLTEIPIRGNVENTAPTEAAVYFSTSPYPRFGAISRQLIVSSSTTIPGGGNANLIAAR